MAYTDKEKKEIVDKVCDIIESGKSLRKALSTVSVSSKTFYKFIDQDEDKVKQYARACAKRADSIFEDILDIADETENDKILEVNDDGSVTSKVNHEVIQRSKLRTDVRKWMASKLNPKKYGDKIDHTTGGDKIQSNDIVVTIVPPEDQEE